MRLVIATQQGLHVVRWVRGERSGRTEAVALPRQEVRAVVRGRSATWATTRSGEIHRSDDRGSTWTRISPGVGVAGVSLAVTARGPEALYLGTEPAALHVSRDGGVTWTELSGLRAMETLESEEWQGYGDRAPHVESVACDPTDPSRLYVGVEIGGAYRSADGGATWEPINEGLYDDVHRLAVHPRDGSRLYAATGGGLHLSRDRGGAWAAAAGEPGSAYCTDVLVPASREGSAVYTATAAGTPSSWSSRGDAQARLWVSRDAGESWEAADGGSRLRGRRGYVALAEDDTRGGAVFVATGEGTVYAVEAEGERWSKILFGLPPVAGMVAV